MQIRYCYHFPCISVEKVQMRSDLPWVRHSRAYVNPRPRFSLQPRAFAELYRERTKSRICPHDHKGRAGEADLKRCVLGKVLKPAQFAGDQVLTYLNLFVGLGEFVLCLFFYQEIQ